MPKKRIEQNARKILAKLTRMGSMSISEVCKHLNLTTSEAYMAIGWLTHEGIMDLVEHSGEIHLISHVNVYI